MMNIFIVCFLLQRRIFEGDVRCVKTVPFPYTKDLRAVGLKEHNSGSVMRPFLPQETQIQFTVNKICTLSSGPALKDLQEHKIALHSWGSWCCTLARYLTSSAVDLGHIPCMCLFTVKGIKV